MSALALELAWERQNSRNANYGALLLPLLCLAIPSWATSTLCSVLKIDSSQ